MVTHGIRLNSVEDLRRVTLIGVKVSIFIIAFSFVLSVLDNLIVGFSGFISWSIVALLLVFLLLSGMVFLLFSIYFSTSIIPFRDVLLSFFDVLVDFFEGWFYEKGEEFDLRKLISVYLQVLYLGFVTLIPTLIGVALASIENEFLRRWMSISIIYSMLTSSILIFTIPYTLLLYALHHLMKIPLKILNKILQKIG